ncbi:hypothetical protein VTI74DRAFT_8204 [Chaetomium olivicolor]
MAQPVTLLCTLAAVHCVLQNSLKHLGYQDILDILEGQILSLKYFTPSSGRPHRPGHFSRPCNYKLPRVQQKLNCNSP